MDNRTLLSKLGLTQDAMGKLLGAKSNKTRWAWFRPDTQQPVWINRILAFFASHPESWAAFRKMYDKDY